MMIVDTFLRKLESENRPIKIGLIGAGFAAKGFALQLLTVSVGMKLVAVSNRTEKNAQDLFKDLNITDFVKVNSLAQLSQARKENRHAISTDPEILTSSEDIDVIVEATGEVEFGCNVVLSAIKHKKHVVLINAELDGTLGPILKKYADENGVVYTQADGDQPAKLVNLMREVKSLGFKPVLAGNIKSLIDHYRTPKTQEDFARTHFQRPKHITSFADGTKISYEMATVANAAGFRVGTRGMYGPRAKSVNEAASLFSVDEMKKQGLVDYILGAEPSFGIFVLGINEHPIRSRYMSVYKMGDGPVYTFYVPYHLSPLEAPLSVARAFIFKDAALAPAGKPMTDVITIAKKELKKGEVLDGIGGFAAYGTIENSDICVKENLLPMGLSEGCITVRNIPKDTAITYVDVIIPAGRLSDKLRAEQNTYFNYEK